MRVVRLGVLLTAALLGNAACGRAAATDSESLRQAKALFFDREYEKARGAWQAILTGSRGADADVAAYWIARCSENLGEQQRAFKEYDAFLARRPTDVALAEEARTNRVGLAARLYKAGNKAYLGTLEEGLKDASRTVRYFAALQLGDLGPPVGLPAIPILKRIVSEEKDSDLVDRAKLKLLRLDPASLRESPAPGSTSAPQRQVTWLRVRVFEKGQSKAKVSVNVPVALAEMVFKSLPDEARAELRRKGYDADNFWEKLKRLGPTEIIDIEGDDGERVQIWLE